MGAGNVDSAVLSPPYAGWVCPWILENLQQMQKTLKRILDDDLALDDQIHETLDGLLHEIGGGFWAMELPQAMELAKKGQALLARGAEGWGETVGRLIHAHAWLEESALAAQSGAGIDDATWAAFLEWLDEPRPSNFPQPPLARAREELSRVLDAEIGALRDLMDPWIQPEFMPPEEDVIRVQTHLEGLAKSLSVPEPFLAKQAEDIGIQITEALGHLHSSRSRAMASLVEAGGRLLDLPYRAQASLLNNRGRDIAGNDGTFDEGARKELADTLHQELKRMRGTINLAREQRRACEPMGEPLLQLAGVMSMLGHQTLGQSLQALAGLEEWETHVDALALALSVVEGVAHSLTSYTPHIHSHINPLATEALQAAQKDLAQRPERTAAKEIPEKLDGGEDFDPTLGCDSAASTAGTPKVGVFDEEARQLLGAIGVLLPKWVEQPRLETSMALRRAFHTLKGAAGSAHRQGVVDLAQALEAGLNDALSHIQGPSLALREAVMVAHKCLEESLVGNGQEWIERGSQALREARKKSAEMAAPAADREWASIPAQPREMLHEFMANKWEVLTQPLHPDFWMAVRILEVALGMVGAQGYALALERARESQALNPRARKCLEILHAEHLEAHRGIPVDRLLVVLEENVRLAKEAVARKDSHALGHLLQEQAFLLVEHGFGTKTP